MKKFCAFTLTEILVTLSIIGVVSILTLPNLMASHQNRVHVASLQRVYNMVSNAISLYLQDHEVDDLLNTNIGTVEGRQEFFQKYFDVVQICGSAVGSRDRAYDCFAETYISSDNFSNFAPRSIQQGDTDTVCAILASGPVICLEKPSTDDPYLFLHLDTNGAQKPNKASRDFFARLRIWSDGKIMGYRYNSHTIYMCPDEGGSPITLTATGCFAKIQNDGWQMNY